MADRPYHAWVQAQAAALAAAAAIAPPTGSVARLPRPGARTAMIFAPHPDDEVIIGALPLRLHRELGWQVITVAVTLGSDPARRAARHTEMAAACRYLGFTLEVAGLTGVTPDMATEAPSLWNAALDTIGAHLQAATPDLIVLPHAADWNRTHIGVHRLVVAALQRTPALETLVLETEFWAPMDAPNLMVESSVDDAADLVAALSLHAGEVARNPYHLRLPAWMIDTVRRGAEHVGGQGAPAPPFTFATLYRLRRWANGGWHAALAAGTLLGAGDDVAPLFRHPPRAPLSA